MNNNLLKISGIIAIVAGILYSFTIYLLIVGIPLIWGGIEFLKYSKIKDEKMEEKINYILFFSILFLITTFIGGILGLIYFISIKRKIEKKPLKHYIKELDKLRELKKNKEIDKAEYKKRKQEIFNL